MLHEFIEQTIDFLRKSDIPLHETDLTKTEVNEKGGPTVYLESFVESFSRPQISKNILLHTMVVFSLIDAQIDFQYPDLPSNSFEVRYDNLPSNTDLQIIQKELYRVLRIIRNAVIHQRSSVAYNGTLITVTRGENKKLELTQRGLELIYSFIVDLYAPKGQPEEYTLALARDLYDEIRDNVYLISDNTDTQLATISDRLRLQRSQRRRVINPSYTVDDGIINIQTRFKHALLVQYEYVVNIEDDKYIIPGELLSDMKIPLTEISSWKL